MPSPDPRRPASPNRTRHAPRPSAPRWLPLGLAGLMLAALALGVWWALQGLALARAVGEGRAVADMAENVGRWASQYGGVHVRTQGAQAKLPGSFLTRSVYHGEAAGAAAPAASAATGTASERLALERLESYYWKNPALIQREVADVAAGTGSRVPYRMTARSVLNRDNQPTALELKALDAIQAATAAPNATREAQEFWTVDGGRLLYARAVIAQASCLKCHDTPATAPDFLRTNAQFNGGGGFGYVAGKPAGIISVNVPLPDSMAALGGSLPARAWAALAAAALLALALAAVTLQRPRRRDSSRSH